MRALLRDHRWLAIWLVAVALCMKIMVPSGFMIGAGTTSLTVTICDGHGLEEVRQISLPQTGHAREIPGESGKAAACPYGALGAGLLAGAPAVLLAAALAFILLLRVGLAIARPPAPRPFLRPPLRAPPLLG